MKLQRKFHVSDFPLEVGQDIYNLQGDIESGKANITFGQLMEIAPKMKRKWKALVNPIEKEPKRGFVKILSMSELPDICPTIEAWHKGRNLGEAYIDGGAQVCVITQSCVEHHDLIIAGVSVFKIRMANHQRVKCLGVVQDLELEVFGVKDLVDLHV